MKTTLVLDNGNRGTKYVFRDRNGVLTEPGYVPSLIYRPGIKLGHAAAQVKNTAVFDRSSEGKVVTTVLGEGARHYPDAVAVYRLDGLSPGSGKLQVAQDFVIGIVANHLAATKFDSAEVDVVVLHPNPAGVTDTYRTNLLGDYAITAKGRDFHISIQSVSVQPEGTASYRHCLDSGLIMADQNAAIVDIGGLTAISEVFSSIGAVEFSRRVIERAGVQNLAKRIAQAAKADQPGINIDTETVMDGLRFGLVHGGTSNRYPYGIERTKFYLDAYVAQALKPWVTGLLSTALEAAADYDVDRVVFVGGGAAYISDAAIAALGAEICAKAKQPEFANVLGAALAIESTPGLRAVA